MESGDSLESIMREEQAGFCQGRGCSDHFFVLRTVVDECQEWNCPLVLNFIDFKRAFDSVHRPPIWKILEVYGIPNKVIKILMLLYEDSKSCIRVGQDHTERFSVDTGVIQGDSLSPIIFNVVLEFVLSKLSNIDGGIEWVGSKGLRDLDYADDICLLADKMNAKKIMTDLVVEEARKVGLKVNTRRRKL